MGITDKKGNPYTFQYIRSEVDIIESYINPPMVEETADEISPSVETTPKRTRKYEAGLYKKLVDRSIRTKKIGIRHAKRSENLNFLINMSEQDEPDVADLEFVDLMEHGLTPFAELFVQQEKMKIWNDFINCSEDEQQGILHGNFGASAQCDDAQVTEKGRNDSTGSWDDVGTSDNRSAHPGYSAKECFQRIDQRIRVMLKRKHLPLGTLINMEEEVVSFFLDWPTSVYLSHLTSSFERMLLHALCQYHNLASHSFDSSDGARQTQVENKNADFHLPSKRLSEFIAYRDSNH